MTAVNVTRFRENLKTLLESVVNNHEPVVVTRPDGANVVVLSWEDWTGMEETAYLLRSPANARRLAESLESFKQGSGQVRTLLES
jgi:antitoxin YefM